MRFFSGCLFAAFCLLFTPTAEALESPRDWTVNDSAGPWAPTVDLHGAPGSRLTTRILVKATGTEPVRLEASPQAVETSQGTLQTGPPDFGTAGSWLRLPPALTSDFLVDVGQRTEIPVTVVVPNTAATGEHLAAVTLTRSGTTEHVRVPLRVRVDGQMSTSLTVTKSELTVESGSYLSPVPTSSVTWSYTVRNTGTTIVSGQFQPQLVGLFGRRTSLAPSQSVVLAPGASITGRAHTQLRSPVRVEPVARVTIDLPSSELDRPGTKTERTWTVEARGEGVSLFPTSTLLWLLCAWAAITALWWGARHLHSFSTSRSTVGVP